MGYRFAKNAFRGQENPFEKNEVSVDEKNKTLNSFSELQWNKVVLFCAIIQQGCQHWNLRAQRPFWEKFRNKKCFYILFLEFFVKNLNRTHKLRVCQEGILRVQRNFSRNNHKEKPKLRAPREKIPIFGEKLLAELPKHFSMCPEKHFEKNEFFSQNYKILNLFWLSPRTSESWQNFLPRRQTDL